MSWIASAIEAKPALGQSKSNSASSIRIIHYPTEPHIDRTKGQFWEEGLEPEAATSDDFELG